jgi:hypothetical protein
MSQARVRAALETALDTWADAQTPAISIAWQNVAFTPTAARYLRCTILPAEMVSQDLTGAHRRYLGIMQVDICMPKHTGPAATEALIASLDSTFAPATRFTASGLTVTILNPVSPSPSYQDETHYVTPVSIPYRADT